MRTTLGDEPVGAVLIPVERELSPSTRTAMTGFSASSATAATGCQKQRMYLPMGVPGPTSVRRS